MAMAPVRQFRKLVLDLKRAVGADRCTLFIVDREKKEVWSKVALGLRSKQIRLPVSRGLVSHVVRTGQTLNLPDVYRDARFDRSVDLQTGYRTTSMLAMAVRNEDSQVIGVIQAINKQTAFSKEDEEIMQQSCLAAAKLIEAG